MWTVLGISPTRDTGAIRKAYADRLRAVNKSGDRDAFQQLRSAYERALAYAERKPAKRKEPVAAHAEAGQPEAEDAAAELEPAEPPPKTEADLLLDDIGAALQARDLNAALDIYEHGLATGLVPPGWHDQLLDQIMHGPVSDTAIGLEAYEHLIRRVGWSAEQLGRRISPVRAAALARLDAERWFKGQVETADGAERIWPLLRTTFFLKWPFALVQRRARRRNARLLVAGGWQLPRLLGFGIKDLSDRIALYHLHKDWLAGKIDADDVARAQTVVDAEDDWARNLRYGVVALIAVPLLIALCLTGAGVIGAFFLGRFLVQMYLRKR